MNFLFKYVCLLMRLWNILIFDRAGLVKAIASFSEKFMQLALKNSIRLSQLLPDRYLSDMPPSVGLIPALQPDLTLAYTQNNKDPYKLAAYLEELDNVLRLEYLMHSGFAVKLLGL